MSFRYWRIRPKLVAVVVGPTTLAVLLAVVSAATAQTAVGEYQQSVALLRLDTQVDNLADALQQERDVTNVFVAANRSSGKAAMNAARATTDQAVAGYRSAAASVNGSSSTTLQTDLDAVDQAMQGLGYVRNAVDNAGLTLGAIVGTYSDAVGTLGDLVSYVPTQNAEVAADIRVLGDFFQLTEYTSQLRGEFAGILTIGSFDVGQLQDFINLIGQQQATLGSFRSDGTAAQLTTYANTVQGAAISQVQTIENNGIQAATATQLPGSPANWYQVSSEKMKLLDQVQSSLLAGVVNDVGMLYDNAIQTFVLALTVLLIAVLLSTLMSIVVARSISSQLRQLLASAVEVASSWLPEVMRRLRQTVVDPFADFQINRIDTLRRGEIGEVATAFNSITTACLQLAREQNDLRASMNTAFINLARRNQGCVYGMLRALDDWEKDELDADSLQRLFLLDHMATRMRRTDDSLLIIAGAAHTSKLAKPSPLDEIVSAALSEIEQYTRVRRFAAGAVHVRGDAAVDVVHLLAELFDNATNFSLPQSKVELSFATPPSAADGVTISIRDYGRGMKPEQLVEANALLASTTDDVVSSMRTMGHLVVARIAARHGITVRLHPAPRAGLTAVVTLPRSLLVDSPTAALPTPTPVRRPAITTSTTSGGPPTAPPTAPTSPRIARADTSPRIDPPPAYPPRHSRSDHDPEATGDLPVGPRPAVKTFTLEECLAIRRGWREQQSS
jgi:signal transduction histidine kinase